MNASELERRQQRAETENFVIAKTNDGYRIFSPLTPANQYLVTGSPGELCCSCPDFQNHVQDTDWKCKHVLAIEAKLNSAGSSKTDTTTPATVTTTDRPTATQRNGREQMLIKRSVSPDGHVDSLSVEFACPIGNSSEETKRQAQQALSLQAEITAGFLKTNGKARHSDNGAVPAQLLSVGGMPGKFGGRRLFFNVLVGSQVLKFFGSPQQLGEALAQLGLPELAQRLSEGLELKVPCRVLTKPSADGKYTNVERLLPTQPPAGSRT